MAQNNSYSDRIRKNYQLLVRCIDPSEQLLTELSFDERLTKKIGWVEKAATDDDKNVRLLKMLLSTSTDVVDKFIELLQLQCYEQKHVANVLRGIGEADADKWPMSQQHLDLMRKKKDEMFDYLDPCVELLNFLESRKVLTRNDIDRIQRKQSYREISDELLRILERKPDSAFDSLVEGLHRTQQPQVAFVLTGKGEEPIAIRNRWLLDQVRTELAKNLEPINSNLVDELLKRRAISEREYERVKEEKSRYDQSNYLVDIFKRKSQRAFDCFIKTLKDTGQEHIATILEGVNGTVTLNGISRNEHATIEEDMVSEMDNQYLLQTTHPDGILTTIEKGSIKIRFSCVFPGSLTKLRELYEAGTIDKLLYEQHGHKFSERGLQSMRVNIPLSEFKRAESRALMTPEHRRLLQSAADKFAPTFVVTQQLLSRLSLCNRRQRAILSQPTDEQRSRRLFDIVSRQADSAFQQLVDALLKTGNLALASHLQNGRNVFPKSDSPYFASTMPAPGSTTTTNYLRHDNETRRTYTDLKYRKKVTLFFSQFVR